MSTIKRRINSTGRKRIPKERIKVSLTTTDPDEPLRASVALDLAGLGFPLQATVVVDAYHRSTSMRFECGTVGDLKIPSALTLSELGNDGGVLFRVKVIDKEALTGRLLGAAERIRADEANEVDGRRSILPVIERNIGGEVWRLDIDEGGPQLILNNRVPGISTRLLSNPMARGLLLPAAFRLVLLRLIDEAMEDDPDETDWKVEWIRFTQSRLGLPEDLASLPQDDDGKAEWIDNAVSVFCEKLDFLTLINTTSLAEPGHG